MTPGHVAPLDPERIVLEEEVVYAFIKDESVGIVRPVLRGREMELRPVGLRIELVDGGDASEDVPREEPEGHEDRCPGPWEIPFMAQRGVHSP
jgi:hypothetical protein